MSTTACSSLQDPFIYANPSISLPRRLRARTPTHTPLIMPPHPQPLLRPQLQLPLQLGTRLLPMDEIAEPSSDTPFPTVETTTCFSEIGDRGELAVDGARSIPAAVEGVAGLLGRVFVFEARVDVADEVCCGVSYFRGKIGRFQLTVIVVIADYDLLRLAVLAHLAPKVLVERVKMVLQLAGVHLVFGIVGGVLVEVGEEDGLRVGGFDMFPRTAIAVAAGTDFVVEGAVDLWGYISFGAGELGDGVC